MEQITPTPWSIDRDGKAIEIVCNDMAVCQMRFYGDEEQAQAEKEAAAIVSAVNNTYGQNINPEAVRDLLEACKAAARYLDITGQNDELFQKLQNAVQKTKIV